MIKIHISPNISRGKVNQTMKYTQLIEYIMKNNFLKKFCAECGGETIQKNDLEKCMYATLF